MQVNDFIAWGKLNRTHSGSAAFVHPLLDHMLDVAFCFLALADTSAVKRAMNLAANRTLNQVDLSRLAVLAFLHIQSRVIISPEEAGHFSEPGM